MNEKNIHIQLLKKGYENSVFGISYNDIFDLFYESGFLTKTEYEILKVHKFGKWNPANSEQKNMINKQNFIHENIIDIFLTKEIINPKTEYVELRFFLKFKSTKFYIDYLELKHANENAQEAKKISTKAIRLSYLTIAVSIAFGCFQLYQSHNLVQIQTESPITLNSTQVKELKFDSSKIELLLSGLNEEIKKLPIQYEE